MELIFWVSVFLLVYHYGLYPLAVISLAMRKVQARSSWKEINEESLPTVSLIVAAYNEEAVIKAKIENSLQLDYPKEKLQIIIVCDGSDDRSPEIVRSYHNDGVECLYNAERKGKSDALNRAVEYAKGEILLFSDANNDFNSNAVKVMVTHFDVDNVGGVCGVKCIKPDDTRDSSMGDGLYWKYESAIKLAESKLNSITCADGEIFALRKSLYEPIQREIINDDLELTISLINRGYVVLYEKEAQSSEFASIEVMDDFWVKVRMVAGGYQALNLHFKELINIFKLFNFMFVSHKVLRWTAPLFLILVFLSSLILCNKGGVYALSVWLQFIFYGLAVYAGTREDKSTLPSILYIPFYFSFMNIAAFWGMVRHLSGSQKVAWRKAAR